MSEDALHVRLELPYALERLPAAPASLQALWQEDLLLLRVLNLPDGHREGEAERGPERMEAKLDLTLHLLARALHGQRPPPPPAEITLRASGFALPTGDTWRGGGSLLLTLYPSAVLPLPLVLPADVVGTGPGGLRADWQAMPEPLREAWEQWLFRQHRRAVHDLRRGGG